MSLYGKGRHYGARNRLNILNTERTVPQSKIFTSSLDVIGVVGFGTTNKVPETLDFNNIR